MFVELMVPQEHTHYKLKTPMTIHLKFGQNWFQLTSFKPLTTETTNDCQVNTEVHCKPDLSLKNEQIYEMEILRSITITLS